MNSRKCLENWIQKISGVFFWDMKNEFARVRRVHNNRNISVASGQSRQEAGGRTWHVLEMSSTSPLARCVLSWHLQEGRQGKFHKLTNSDARVLTWSPSGEMFMCDSSLWELSVSLFRTCEVHRKKAALIVPEDKWRAKPGSVHRCLKRAGWAPADQFSSANWRLF